MSKRFFRSNRPGYPHQVYSELENSGIRATVGDCSVTKRRRRRPPYQTGKTIHVHTDVMKTEDIFKQTYFVKYIHGENLNLFKNITSKHIT